MEHIKSKYTQSQLSGIVTSRYDGYYHYLNSAESLYPCFKDWYYYKVIPDVVCGEREIITEVRNNVIAGISIIKHGYEKKLSTLKVMDDFQNKGIGLKLFEKSFEKLETDKPFLTVSEDKLPEFKKLFDYYGFKLTNIYNGLYRNDKKEYFFNEGN